MSYVIAHRGFWLQAPENTIPAFQDAIEVKVDGIETDIQLTLDGQLVIHHNYSVDGTADKTGKISEMTLKELKTLDFGSYRGERYRGLRIATLEECLETVRPLAIVNLELKAPMDRDFPYVEAVVETVRRFHMESKVILSAFDHSLLARAKKLCPGIRVGALVLPPPDSGSPIMKIVRSALPVHKSLSAICREDIILTEEEKHILGQADIVAQEPEDVAVELAHSLSAIYPNLDLGQVEDLWGRQRDLDSYIGHLDFKMDFLHPNYQMVLQDQSMISRLADRGILVNPYTPDDPKELKQLWDLGCYGIITNRPDLLMKIKETPFLCDDKDDIV